MVQNGHLNSEKFEFDFLKMINLFNRHFRFEVTIALKLMEFFLFLLLDLDRVEERKKAYFFLYLL